METGLFNKRCWRQYSGLAEKTFGLTAILVLIRYKRYVRIVGIFQLGLDCQVMQRLQRRT